MKQNRVSIIILIEHIYYLIFLSTTFILPYYLLPKEQTVKYTETENITIYSPYTKLELNVFNHNININYLGFSVTSSVLFQTIAHILFHSPLISKWISKKKSPIPLELFEQLKNIVKGTIIAFVILFAFGAPLWLEIEGLYETLGLSVILSLYCFVPLQPFIGEASFKNQFFSLAAIYFDPTLQHFIILVIF